MNNILLFLGGLLLIVLTALFAVPLFVDWSSYRGTFEEETSRLLGREVRVGGRVNLRLLPSPYVRFEKVRIADNTGSFGDPFLRADSFTLWLSVPPLLRGAIEANEIELARPVLHLATDSKGEGNWQGFGGDSGNLPFVPTDVALSLVKIRDGAVALHSSSGTERVRFENINGEFSAPALEGPYKFRGRLKSNGLPRDVRISTAARQPDGRVPVKAVVTTEGTQATTTLDGLLVDITKVPKFEGDLEMHWPLLQSIAINTGSGVKAPDTSSAELKAKVSADGNGLLLDDIAIAFEETGKPQLLAGSARVDWREAIAGDVQLSSRWLDLDHIAAADNSQGPAAAVGRLAGLTMALLPGSAKTRLKLKVEQANFGGDTISAFAADVERSGDSVRINEVRAALPGSSTIVANGELTGAGDKMLYRGPVFIRGANLSRFLSWLHHGPTWPELKPGSVFSLSGEVTASEEALALTQALGEVVGANFNGEANYRWKGERKLALRFDSDRLELSALLPSETTFADLRKTFPQLGGNGSATGAGPALDSTIAVRIGQLSTGNLMGRRMLRDVAADLRIVGGAIKIPAAKFSSDDGLGLEIEGEIANYDTKPKGTLRFLAEAGTAASIDGLAELLELPAPMWPGGAQAKALAPVRLAGTAVMGTRTADSADINIDGALGDSRVSLLAKLDGGATAWRSQPNEVTALLQQQDGSQLLQQIIPSRVKDANTAIASLQSVAKSAGPGRLSLRLSGIPDDGMVIGGRIDTTSLTADVNGKMSMKDNATGFDGNVSVAAADAADLFALAGFKSTLGLAGSSLEGTARVIRSENRVKLDQAALKIAGTEANLSGTFDTKPGAPIVANVAVAVADVDITKLIGLVLDSRGQGAIAAARSIISGQPVVNGDVWPDAAFDFSAAGEMQGQVKLRAGRLRLDGDLALRNAMIDARLGADGLEVTDLSGDAVGGKMLSHWKLEKTPAGAVLSGGLRLDTADLEKLGSDPDGAPIAKGRANLEFEVKGKGSSPRGMINLATGSGSLKLGPATLARFAPGAVAATSEAVLTGKLNSQNGGLEAALDAALHHGSLSIGPRTIDIELSDGALKLNPTVVETNLERLISRTNIDLASLAVVSDWRIEPKPNAERKSERERVALPSASVLVSGSLGSLGQLRSKLTSDTLERELSVRKMEREVEELERLRREAEKRRDEQLAAEAAAKAAAAHANQNASGIAASQTPASVVPNAAQNQIMPLTLPPPSRLGVPAEVNSEPPVAPAPPAITSQPLAQGAASRAPEAKAKSRNRPRSVERQPQEKTWDAWQPR